MQHERAGKVSPRARKLPAKSLAKRGSSERREEAGESASCCPRPSDAAYPSGVERMDGWWRTRGVRGRQGAGFDPTGPHVG